MYSEFNTPGNNIYTDNEEPHRDVLWLAVTTSASRRVALHSCPSSPKPDVNKINLPLSEGSARERLDYFFWGYVIRQ